MRGVLRRTQEHFTNMTVASIWWGESGQCPGVSHDCPQVLSDKAFYDSPKVCFKPAAGGEGLMREGIDRGMSRLRESVRL